MRRFFFALVVTTSSLVAHASARWHAREMKPTSDAVAAVAPLSPPNAAHPEGTVAISAGYSTFEVDVARGAIVARQPFDCGVLHQLSSGLFGSCGGDIVAFGPSLAVTWRAHWATGPHLSGKDLYAKNLFVSGSRVVATFWDLFHLVVRVASTSGAVIAEVDTKATLFDARAVATIYVHGTTVIAFASHFAAQKNTLVALTPDALRVAATRDVASSETVWDDGVHVHVSKASSDVTLDDMLRPIQLGPPHVTPTITSAFPITQTDGNVHGSGLIEEFDLGPNHFWFTFGCCGDQGGVFVAKVR